MKGNKRSRITENPLVFSNDTTGSFFHLIKVFAILHTDYPFYTTGSFTTVVSHSTTTQRTIRDINNLIITGSQDRMENLNFTNRARDALAFNQVTYFIRTEQQYNQTTCKVLQVTGQCHTDSHTGGCQQGSK